MKNVIPHALLSKIIGLDQFISQAMDQVGQRALSYPPYNLSVTGENDYQLEFAVAGFSKEDIGIKTEEGVLTVSGKRKPKDGEAEEKAVVAEGEAASSSEEKADGEAVKAEEKPGFKMLHKGISDKPFEVSFKLAEYVVVKSAKMENGLLTIKMVREVPEAQKEKFLDIE